MKIIIIDYGLGNVRSIQNAFKKFGVSPVLSKDKSEIRSADGVILPGVGAFSHGMGNLEKYSLVEVLREYAELDKPLLGICLGMQMLLDESEEFGVTRGLGIIPGKVVRLSAKDGASEKIPHVSWNEIRENGIPWDNTILNKISTQSDMYFVHSYVSVPADNGVTLAVCEYANSEFCAVIGRGNIYGCQFHPEKSSENGLKVISNFINICKKRVNDV